VRVARRVWLGTVLPVCHPDGACMRHLRRPARCRVHVVALDWLGGGGDLPGWVRVMRDQIPAGPPG